MDEFGGLGGYDSARPGSWYTKLLGALLALSMMLLLGLGFSDVFGRYALNAPISGAFSIIGMFLGLTVFTGLPIISRDHKHISVSLLEGYFRGPARRVQQIFVYLISLVSVGFIAERMFWLGRDMLESQELFEALDWPTAPFSFAFSGLAAFTFILLLRQAPRVLTQGEMHEP